MGLPLDASSLASAELSALIDRLANDPAIEEPVTLATLRQHVERSRVDNDDRTIWLPEKNKVTRDLFVT